MTSDSEKTAHFSSDSTEKGVRLAKYLATAGIGSRRSCEEYIQEGRVTVNGEAVTKVGTCVSSEDEVRFEGKLISVDNRPKVYLMLNKPVGYTCSAKDVHASNLVLQLIPERFGRLFTVGRLDRDSEGLLLLTNDGDFAQRLTHPSHEIYKRYYVECAGRFTTAIRRQLLEGMYDNGEFLQALEVEQVSVQYGSCKLIFTLGEGRKREVRRLCKDVGLRVLLLRRISIGKLELDSKLTVGSWRIMSLEDCELALKPVEVPKRARSTEPPKPYWMKEKSEREERGSRTERGDRPSSHSRHNDHGEHASRDHQGSARPRNGYGRQARRPLRDEGSYSAQLPWYERDNSPGTELEEERAPSPRFSRPRDGRDARNGEDHEFHRGRGATAGKKRDGRGKRFDSQGDKQSKTTPRSFKDQDYRRGKPPRSWR